MELRARVTAALKDAMKAKEAHRLSTLRLINAAIKDRDIAARAGAAEGGPSEVGESTKCLRSSCTNQRDEHIAKDHTRNLHRFRRWRNRGCSRGR